MKKKKTLGDRECFLKAMKWQQIVLPGPKMSLGQEREAGRNVFLLMNREKMEPEALWKTWIINYKVFSVIHHARDKTRSCLRVKAAGSKNDAAGKL